MKKKLIKLVAICLVATMLIGCGEATATSTSLLMGEDSMVEIGDFIWYDASTGIVYWWNNYPGHTMPTPYYSPNGYLYRYIPQTNTLEEIIPTN